MHLIDHKMMNLWLNGFRIMLLYVTSQHDLTWHLVIMRRYFLGIHAKLLKMLNLCNALQIPLSYEVYCRLLKLHHNLEQRAYLSEQFRIENQFHNHVLTNRYLQISGNQDLCCTCTDTTMLKWTRHVDTWQIFKNTRHVCQTRLGRDTAL